VLFSLVIVLLVCFFVIRSVKAVVCGSWGLGCCNSCFVGLWCFGCDLFIIHI
jgi:hypothetical protein